METKNPLVAFLYRIMGTHITGVELNKMLDELYSQDHWVLPDDHGRTAMRMADTLMRNHQKEKSDE